MTSESPRLTPSEIRQAVDQYEWYHRIDLGDGVVTPGQYDLTPMLPHYGLPDDMAGLSVLDIGPAHGFFAFEFERRGAVVTTAELPSWSEHDVGPSLQSQFESFGDRPVAYHRGAFGFAIEARRSRVNRLFCNVYDLTPERVGMHDLVFCASVLLHLTDPLRALFAIRKVCKHQAIICTGIDIAAHAVTEPRALFVGQPDGQAFWLPTVVCLEQMVRAAGFPRHERVSTFHLKSLDGLFNTPHGTVRAFIE
jgi:tRNA (mo5U34)-methyltransferase